MNEVQAYLHDEALEVAQSMEKHGSGFIKALGTALIKADQENKLIIKLAWPHYWQKYLEQSRSEHLTWCKRRALEYCDAGDYSQALASFQSDMRKHVATRDHAALELMAQLAMAGHLLDVSEMRKFIEAFN